MYTSAARDASVQRIRDRIDHPIVDADAHQLEFVPVVLEYLREAGGADVVDRFIKFLQHLRRTFGLSDEARRDQRATMPVWWPMPTEKTVVVVGDKAYVTREEAEAQVKVVCKEKK